LSKPKTFYGEDKKIIQIIKTGIQQIYLILNDDLGFISK
jgi:hypothetical protein